METATLGTVIVAEADRVGSLTEVAVSVTVRLFAAGLLGAVYVVVPKLAVDVEENVPHAATAHDRLQVTPLFAVSPLTVAWNCAVPATWTVAVPGATETVIPEGTGTVITTESDFVESATDVAVSLTFKVTTGGPGAV
jgi:hypothetical protein